MLGLRWGFLLCRGQELAELVANRMQREQRAGSDTTSHASHHPLLTPPLRWPDSRESFQGSRNWENLNGGLANGGSRHLSTIVHNCLRVSSFYDESSP